MKFIIITLTFWIFGLTLKAQKADLDFVHSAVEVRFNLDLDTVNHCETYILNGVPFDKEDFANELKSYKSSEIRFATIANLTNTTWFHRKCDPLAGSVAKKRK